MAKAIHSMIRVLDLDRSIEFYRDAFGLEIATHLDFETFALVYLRNDESDFELELTLNKGRTEPYEHGEAYGHLAFCVDDAAAEHARLASQRIEPQEIKELSRDGSLLARFFFVTDPDGYRVEVIERHGRYR